MNEYPSHMPTVDKFRVFELHLIDRINMISKTQATTSEAFFP